MSINKLQPPGVTSAFGNRSSTETVTNARASSTEGELHETDAVKTSTGRRNGANSAVANKLRLQAHEFKPKQRTTLKAPPRINSLPSGVKIAAGHIDALSGKQLADIAERLGIAPADTEGGALSPREIEQRLQQQVAGKFRRLVESALPVTLQGNAASGASSPYHAATLDDYAALFPSLEKDPAKLLNLGNLMVLANARIHIDDSTDPRTVTLHFGGTNKRADFIQDAYTAVGLHGKVFDAVREIAATWADNIGKQPGYQLDMVTGHSLGGGAAQYFKAALESKVDLGRHKPSMILLDPQLLNNKQGLHAVKNGVVEYGYEKPRGVAITLNYDKSPKKNLMGLQKSSGFYRYPGLAELKLPLLKSDAPTTAPLLGYHYEQLFAPAIRRFIAAPASAKPGTVVST